MKKFDTELFKSKFIGSEHSYLPDHRTQLFFCLFLKISLRILISKLIEATKNFVWIHCMPYLQLIFV